LVFSSGCDFGSAIDKVELANRILSTDVIVDSVYLTTNGDECGDLARLSKLTGGFSFKPANPEVGLRIFEKESFVCACLRPDTGGRARPGLSLDAFNATPILFDAEIENTSLIHITRLDQSFQTGRYALAQDEKSGKCQERRDRRVLDEMLAFMCNPVPFVEVYMQLKTIFEWNCFIRPPDGTPYSGRIWPLTIIFGPLYPAEPPLLRFSTIPYHLNVSEDGKVCLDIVTSAYIHTITMRDILVAVRQMFQTPQPLHAVQIEKLMNWLTAKDEYTAAAVASAEGANEDMETWLLTVKVQDDRTFVPPGGLPEPVPLVPDLTIDYPAVRLFSPFGKLPLSDDDVI
jgi:ubiquitin-protein ligase